MIVFQSIQPLINDWHHWLKVVRLRLEYLFSTISTSVSRTQDIRWGECSLSDPGMVCALLEEERGRSEIPRWTCCLCFLNETTPPSPGLLLTSSFSFALSLSVSGRSKSPNIFFLHSLRHFPECVDIYRRTSVHWHAKKKTDNNNTNNKFRLLSPNSPTKDMNASALFLLGASPFLSWLLYGAETFSWECARERSGEERNALLAERKGKKTGDRLSRDLCKTSEDTPTTSLHGDFSFFQPKYSSLWNISSLKNRVSGLLSVQCVKYFGLFHISICNLQKNILQITTLASFVLFFFAQLVNKAVLLLKVDTGLG